MFGSVMACSRGGTRSRPQTAGEALALQAESLEDRAVRQEISACVREFVGRLPDKYRTVVVLSDLEGFTVRAWDAA
jgi:DNA-directed RNA polymerase specialized sigma24 family protein